MLWNEQPGPVLGGSANACARSGVDEWGSRRSPCPRHTNSENGALAGRRFHRDGAIEEIRDDVARDREPQSRALAKWFGGEKLVKNPGDVFGRDTGSLVLNLNHHRVAVFLHSDPDFRIWPGRLAVGVDRVGEKIRQRLSEFPGIAM